MKGVKVLGDKFVPANKTSVKVDFTSMAVVWKFSHKLKHKHKHKHKHKLHKLQS